ncbi:MAG: hypothetical protein WBK55_10490 [Alphaproteobacteria bacterium]
MANDELQNDFQKNSEKIPRKKGLNFFGRAAQAKLKLDAKSHIFALRAKYFPRLWSEKRADLEAQIFLSVANMIAHAAHKGQLIKVDETPYITHPRHIASKLRDFYEKQIALLHDVLENSNLTAKFLLDIGFPKDVVADIVLLKHDKKKTPYLDYIRNLGRSLRAGRVKIQDLKHNMDPKRTIPGERTEWDIYKRECYEIALSYLQAIQDGKIEPGSSIVKYLTMEPYDYLLEESGDMKFWPPEKKTQHKAKQLYITRNTLLNMSSESPEIGNFWDKTIKKLVDEKLLPAPQPPYGHEEKPDHPQPLAF